MKKLVPIVLCLFVVCIVSGCFTRQEEKPRSYITLAMQEWVGYGLFYLAYDKGFFKDEGIELLFVDEKLDSARRDAFKAGMLDCEAATIDLLISKRAQGTPIFAVCELDRSLGNDAGETFRDNPGIIISTLNVRMDFALKNPDVVKGLMRGWFRAMGYYREHSEEASRIIAKYYSISPEEYRTSVKGLEWSGYVQQRNAQKNNELCKVFDAIAEMKLNNNSIREKPEAASAINTIFLEQLYEDSK
jgi:ABC-type nitrate/sulfonate/bicarbonate transport system substrate-binding protein